MPRRRVAVVTTSRADYGHLYWPLRRLAAHPGVDVSLVAIGAHLSPEFGQTIREIRADGFDVDESVECLLSSDSDVGMAKTIGVATLGLADALGRLRPDLLLLIADRYELLAPASVAVALRIPIAHVEGGEVSRGAIDDAVRNALTKLAHVHFTATELSARRVVGMGEEPWRVHHVGAPSLDHLRERALLEPPELERRLEMPLDPPPLVASVHPVTMQEDTTREPLAVLEALERAPGPVAICFPNADAGSRALVARARELCAARDDARLYVNIDHIVYWSLLANADALGGNSSSGIMETPSLALPTVDVGTRQEGRERARNVIDAAAEPEAVLRALERARSEAFRRSLDGMTNPYGDGRAGERIADVLARVPLGGRLLVKAPVEPAPAEDAPRTAG